MIKKDLANGITVYRDVFNELEISNFLNIIRWSQIEHTDVINPNPEEFDKHKKIPEGYTTNWEKWGDLGAKIIIDAPGIQSLYQEKKEKYNTDDIQLLIKIDSEFKEIFQDYLNCNIDSKILMPFINDFNINSKNWQNTSWQVLRYIPLKLNASVKIENVNQAEHLAMGFHSDDVSSNWDASHKHAVTLNFYINDDYVGGNINFLYGENIENINNFDNLKIISYKPKAGDIVVYPANWPVSHSVSPVFINERYATSSILIWKYDGSMGQNLSKYIIQDKLLFNDVAEKVEKNNIQYINGKDFFND